MQRPNEWLDAIPNCANCANGKPGVRFVRCLDAKAAKLYGAMHEIRCRFLCNYYTKQQRH